MFSFLTESNKESIISPMSWMREQKLKENKQSD